MLNKINKITHRGSLLLGIWVVAGLMGCLLLAAEPAHSQAFEPLMGIAPLTPPKAPEPSRSIAFTPMTGEQRWQDFKKVNLESRGALFQTFFTGLGDTTGNVPHWDSGALGFSEHMGSEFARFTIAGGVHSSLAAALHQDTRYFPCNCRGGLHRTFHAMSRTLITYDDQGRRRPDISGLAGIYAGPMIMTSWYPDKYTALGYGVRQGNIAVGITTAIYVIREFSPDIKRSLHLRQRGSREP
jgi:hypothetical protein